jgi:hypothetical protein
MRGLLAYGPFAHEGDSRSIRGKRSGAKAKTSGAKANAFLRDDDTNSPTRNSGE